MKRSAYVIGFILIAVIVIGGQFFTNVWSDISRQVSTVHTDRKIRSLELEELILLDQRKTLEGQYHETKRIERKNSEFPEWNQWPRKDRDRWSELRLTLHRKQTVFNDRCRRYNKIREVWSAQFAVSNLPAHYPKKCQYVWYINP